MPLTDSILDDFTARLPPGLLDSGGPFILCVSGGRDSMVLLELLAGLARRGRLEQTPRVFHFNHELRASADDDESFVIQRSQELDLPCYVDRGNTRRFVSLLGLKSLEEGARILRYRSLLRLIKRFPGWIPVTAHHADDYLESLLIHLVRGGGADALETMPLYGRVFADLVVFRPLLLFDRAWIEEVVERARLIYVEDETNRDRAHLRNRLRESVVPLLKSEGLKSTALWKNFHDINPEPALSTHSRPGHLSLDRRLFAGATSREAKRLLDGALLALGLSPASRSFVHEFLSQLKRSGRIRYRNRQLIVWSDTRSAVWFFLANCSALRKHRATAALDGSLVQYNETQRLIKHGSEERVVSFEPGMRVRTSAGSRKLKQCFQEWSLPGPVRPMIPLLASREDDRILRVFLSFWEGGTDISFE